MSGTHCSVGGVPRTLVLLGELPPLQYRSTPQARLTYDQVQRCTYPLQEGEIPVFSQDKLWLPPLSPRDQKRLATLRRKKWQWVGFSDKTLWNWLQFLGGLAIPLVLVLGTLWLGARQSQMNEALLKNQHDTALAVSQQQRETEQAIAADQQREATLNTYFDRMSALLLDTHWKDPNAGAGLRALARARTLTAVRSLDPFRKGILVQFLYEAGLINNVHTEVDLTGADLSHADLSHTTLSNANLSGVNLSGATLFGADLRHATLTQAFLFEATLTDAFLNNATLVDANLSDATLIATDLTGANLIGASLDEANLSHAYLRGAFLISTSLHDSMLSDARLIKAVLPFANLSSAILTRADLSSAIVAHATLTLACLGNAVLTHADLSNTDLFGADLSSAMLNDATLTGATLTETNLTGANLTNANLTGATLTGANLTDALLRGAHILNEQLTDVRSLKGAILPGGSTHP